VTVNSEGMMQFDSQNNESTVSKDIKLNFDNKKGLINDIYYWPGNQFVRQRQLTPFGVF
jgi:hypothetical protein